MNTNRYTKVSLSVGVVALIALAWYNSAKPSVAASDLEPRYSIVPERYIIGGPGPPPNDTTWTYIGRAWRFDRISGTALECSYGVTYQGLNPPLDTYARCLPIPGADNPVPATYDFAATQPPESLAIQAQPPQIGFWRLNQDTGSVTACAFSQEAGPSVLHCIDMKMP